MPPGPPPVHLLVTPIDRLYGSLTGGTLVIGQQGVIGVAAGAGGLVLAGACATLMALILIAYEQRRQELAVRLALGCSGSRLFRELAVELAGMVLIGSTGAVLLAGWALDGLPSLSLPGGLELNRLDLSVDWRVAAFGLLAATLTLGMAALLPLRRATAPDLISDLAASTSRSTPTSFGLRRVLLATQVAATIVVLMTAGLFVRTVVLAFAGESGFDTTRTLFVELQARSNSGSKAEHDDRIRLVHTRLRLALDRLRQVPGVEAVALGQAPLGLDQAVTAGRTQTITTDLQRHQRPVSVLAVGPSYLEALAVQLRAGRPLTDADARSDPREERPAILSASLAQLLWPDGEVLGRRVVIGGSRYEVIGVAADVAHGSLRLDQRAAVYVVEGFERATQHVSILLVLRTADDASALRPSVRAAIAAEFPGSPRVDIATGREIVTRDLGRERLGAWFFSGFGLVALVLGAGGVFGLAGHLVEARRREIGVRLALGATIGSVVRLAVRSSLRPVAVGVLVGTAVAVLVAIGIQASMAGIARLDVLTSAIVAGLMLTCATTAGVVGAWRARRISAADALRE